MATAVDRTVSAAAAAAGTSVFSVGVGIEEKGQSWKGPPPPPPSLPSLGVAHASVLGEIWNKWRIAACLFPVPSFRSPPLRCLLKGQMREWTLFKTNLLGWPIHYSRNDVSIAAAASVMLLCLSPSPSSSKLLMV